MNKITLSKKNNIFIYGAGDIGRMLCLKLKEAGYIVKAFIDENGSRFQQIDGVSVITPNDYQKVDNPVLIITLNNGLDHYIIARKFRNMIKDIVYIPFGDEYNAIWRQSMRFAYIEIVNNYNFKSKIPQEEYFSRNDILEVINPYYKNHVSFYCPTNMIFTQSSLRKPLQRFNGNARIVSNQLGIPLLNIPQMQELFDRLADETATIDSVQGYLVRAGRETEEDQRELLENRKKLYAEFKRMLAEEPYMFLDSPARCKVEGEHLVVIDGAHRIYFLDQQGWDRVPVITTKTEYEKFGECLANRMEAVW